jgi:4-hydroxybenzoate polyprenyltransferase
MMTQLRLILKSMRPRQWLKNIFVFAALVFDRQLFSYRSFLTTSLAVLLFCLVSSLSYLINDLVDIEADRKHPKKQHRPLASGELSQKNAIIGVIILAVVVFPASFVLDLVFGLIISAYFLLMVAYSMVLKRIPLLDVMVIATGFVLRVAAGVVVINIDMLSPWLFVATTFLALFIALGKRRAEMALLQDEAGSHRQVLQGYTKDFLDQLLTIVMSTTLMTYCLYTFSSPIASNNQSMMLTIPFVIYGLFRYLYLIRIKRIGGAPEEIILTDRHMQITITFWSLTVILILYFL